MFFFSEQMDIIEKFKCIEKRYSVTFFVRWFERTRIWLINTIKDNVSSVMYVIDECMDLINSG